ncbi:hypothetical protein NPIL_70811, partial [Nephila pilipes]
ERAAGDKREVRSFSRLYPGYREWRWSRLRVHNTRPS